MSNSQEFRINTKTYGDQIKSWVATLADNKIITTWSGIGDGSGTGIYAQQFYNNSTFYQGELLVNTYTSYDQTEPKVSRISNDKFAVVWTSVGNDNSGSGISGKIFYNNGSEYKGEYKINTYKQNDQNNPHITSLLNDKFAVVWASVGEDGSGLAIIGSIFNNDFIKLKSDTIINTHTQYDQKSPKASFVDDDNFVVVWTSVGQDGSGEGIFGQIINSNMQFYLNEFQVNTFSSNDQYSPDVASFSNGNFVAVWTSVGNDGSGTGVSFQIFNKTGTKYKTEYLVNQYKSNDQYEAKVAVLSSNKFVVVWTSVGVDGSGTGISCRILNSDGTAYSNEYRLNINTQYDQYQPAVTALENDFFCVTWTSVGADGSGTGIYSRIFDSINFLDKTTTIAVTSTTVIQSTTETSTTIPQTLTSTSIEPTTTNESFLSSTVTVPPQVSSNVSPTSTPAITILPPVTSSDAVDISVGLTLCGILALALEVF